MVPRIVLVQGDDLALLLLLYHTICHGLLVVCLCPPLDPQLRLLRLPPLPPSIARLALLGSPAAGCRLQRKKHGRHIPGWSLQWA